MSLLLSQRRKLRHVLILAQWRADGGPLRRGCLNLSPTVLLGVQPVKRQTLARHQVCDQCGAVTGSWGRSFATTTEQHVSKDERQERQRDCNCIDLSCHPSMASPRDGKGQE